MARTYLERAAQLTEDLRAAYGERLESVVLYGSAARGDFQEGVSDLNVLVILGDVSPAALRRTSSLARKWVDGGNPPPLMFGHDEWQRSADAFPIEFSDIQAAHKVLHGSDPFADVVVDREHLRLRCEHELKSKQILLREGYLLAAEKPEEIGALLTRSFSTFLVLFRTVLRLVDAPVPQEPEATLSEAAARIGFDPEPLRQIARARRSRSAFKPPADDPVTEGYLDAVARTVEFVDRLAAV